MIGTMIICFTLIKLSCHWYRQSCENETCIRESQIYCKDHCKVLCNQWYTNLHFDWNWDDIKTQDEVLQYLDSVKNVLNTTLSKVAELEANKHILSFDEEFSMYSELVEKIESEVNLKFL